MKYCILRYTIGRAGNAYPLTHHILRSGTVIAIPQVSISLSRANRRRRRGAKPRDLGSFRDSPAAGGSTPAPRPDKRARGSLFGPRAPVVVSLAHRVLGRTMSGRR